ncbi:Chromate resistance protein ChrB [Nonomuraea sediminis]|uniref:Chromate resistance protein ChrB n=1 Tax=Nonomuraea sediminis TaxID=2835864 RepID=UPI001BDCB360|nr:Chromate resistance protein ChrB [Nonomuraea sediminis]
MTSGEVPDERFLLLVYRVPSSTSRARVAVWRELKRLGALYIQQAVCVLPDRPGVRERLDKIRTRIAELEGESMHFVLDDVADQERQMLVRSFKDNSAKEYAEIVEECETKFFKEIEFERFRGNYTFEEAEEIRQDLEKLKRWLRKVEQRDWMGAPGRDTATAKVAECEQLLEAFEADVYDRVGGPEQG